MTLSEKIENLNALINVYKIDYVEGVGKNTICDVLSYMTTILEELAAKVEIEINP